MSKIELTKTQLEELLVEIITGKRIFECPISGNVFAVRFPTVEEKDSGRIIYAKKYRELIASGLQTRQQVEKIIKDNEVLPTIHFFVKKNLENSIKDMEKSLSITGSEAQKNTLKIDIEKAREKLYNICKLEEEFYENCAEMKAEEARVSYLISCCTLKGEELSSRFWDSYKDYRLDTNNIFASVVKSNFIKMYIGITPQMIRAVARNSEWRNRWKASKQTGSPIFSGASSQWDKNKISICYWSDFYDTIFEYSTPPPEEIINDDDALFDWIREVNRVNAQEAANNKAKTETAGKRQKVNTPYRIRPAKQDKFKRI